MSYRAVAPVRVEPIVFAFGGVGPWLPPPAPDAFFQAELDLEVGEGPASVAIAVRRVAMLDERGEVVARALDAIEVHEARALHGRRAAYAFYESPPFAGVLAPGTRTRLLLGGTLDVRLETLLRSAPVCGRLVLLAADAPIELDLAGPGLFDGPWSSA